MHSSFLFLLTQLNISIEPYVISFLLHFKLKFVYWYVILTLVISIINFTVLVVMRICFYEQFRIPRPQPQYHASDGLYQYQPRGAAGWNQQRRYAPQYVYGGRYAYRPTYGFSPAGRFYDDRRSDDSQSTYSYRSSMTSSSASSTSSRRQRRLASNRCTCCNRRFLAVILAIVLGLGVFAVISSVTIGQWVQLHWLYYINTNYRHWRSWMEKLFCSKNDCGWRVNVVIYYCFAVFLNNNSPNNNRNSTNPTNSTNSTRPINLGTT